MNHPNRLLIAIAFIILFSIEFRAQTTDAKPPVSSVFAVLTKTIESKTATPGQQITFKTITDIVVNGEVVIPKEASFIGYVKDVVTNGEGSGKSAVSLVLEKVVLKDGRQLPVQAIIAAVAAPTNNSLDSDPAYGMMHSNEPKMVGSAGGASRAGGLSASSKAQSNAAVATAEFKGSMDHSLLDTTSSGAVGYEGLSMTWQLTNPPPVTLFASKNKNLRLDAGAQVLLRMSTPRLEQ